MVDLLTSILIVTAAGVIMLATCSIAKDTFFTKKYRWTHNTSGNVYDLFYVTNVDTVRKGFVPTAVYMDMETKALYSRPKVEFDKKFTKVEV